MSLDRYRRPRLIVLHPRSTSYEAARAMADNHVGAVLVVEDQRLVGIATDRDLALDVAAAGLDPRTTFLRDVMSDEVTPVDIDDTIEDVVRVMREHACRRVPVLEAGRPVGIVTLDDLLVERAVDLETVRSIITAQLEVAARFKPAGMTSPAGVTPGRGGERARQRRAARAENTYGRLLHACMRQTGLATREQAERALLIVLGNLCSRLTEDEAQHLLAQLPSKLVPQLDSTLGGSNKDITPDTIEAELRRALQLSPEAATDVLYATCEVIADSVSAGEIEDVRSELPAAMKDLFPPMPYRRAG
ncbi:CBS domain-containing protein [Polyangium sp. 6x1]|uniref:CBS domain-containing protein n=1 Tax=Polyangium sp. 6x1 TaxID=3042689 RepID=UPI002482D640|nr:CBS domain-containing protein [Polyangium sp. 6x1]MDI1451196.1 CBS domain-containing protein [Polyangium sp. 6x1]